MNNHTMSVSEMIKDLDEHVYKWHKLGLYVAFIGLAFFYVTVSQVLAMIWDASKTKKAKKVNKSVEGKDVHGEIAQTSQIYEALEKLAKVSMSNQI